MGKTCAAGASAAAASSSPTLASVGDEGNRVDRFPKVATAVTAGGAAGGAAGGNGASDYVSSHRQPQSSFRLEETVAAPFEGMSGGPGPISSMKQEGLDRCPQQGGGGGGDGTGGGAGSSHMYFGDRLARPKVQQQQLPQRSQGKEPLAARRPGGGPSLSAFLAPPPSQQRRRQQQQQQQWVGEEPGPGGGASLSPTLSPSPALATGAASATAGAGTGAAATGAGQRGMGYLEMPPDVSEYAQAQVRQQELGDNMQGLADYAQAQARQQESLECSDNVQGLDELLLVNDDAVPEMYQGESDADDFTSFAATGSSCGEGREEGDESLRTLEAELMHDGV